MQTFLPCFALTREKPKNKKLHLYHCDFIRFTKRKEVIKVKELWVK